MAGGKPGRRQSITPDAILKIQADHPKTPSKYLMEATGITEADLPQTNADKIVFRKLLGHLMLERLVDFGAAKAGSDAISEASALSAKVDEMAAGTQAKFDQLINSLEFSQKQWEDSNKVTTSLQKEVKHLKDQLHSPQPPAQSIVVSGLVQEGQLTGKGLRDHVQDFLTEKVDPDRAVTVLEVSRLGRFVEDRGDRRVKVTLGSPAEAEAVMRAARKLKTLNAERKAAGQRPVGLDQFLSAEDQAIKTSLRPKWEAARKRGAPKTFWRGCHLFVEGQEVMP